MGGGVVRAAEGREYASERAERVSEPTIGTHSVMIMIILSHPLSRASGASERL